MFRRRIEKPEWPEPLGTRPRVLVEHADECTGVSAARLLEQAGYETAWCGGPDHLRGHRCPLAEGLECGLAAGADVVVHALNLNRPEHKCVLQALREQHPALPVVVEVPGPSIERHADVLQGCTVVHAPMTRSTLTAAVVAATVGSGERDGVP